MLALGSMRWAAADAEDAAQLARQVHDRASARDLSTFSRMELTEKGRMPRVRELVTYRLDRGNGETAYLMRFLAPEDAAGTGLLSINKADGSNEQSLYLPALDRVRRIAGDRKGGRFVGSDLYYEDLQERKPSLDRHRILGQETVAGVPCHVLESVPADPSSSTYHKRISWIDPATSMVMRVDYFEKDDNAPSKRWLVVERKRVQSYWTVTDSRMIDLGTGHETRIVVEVAKYDGKLPPRLFSQQALADERFEADFRP